MTARRTSSALSRRRHPAPGPVARGGERRARDTEPAPDGDYAFTVTVRDRAGKRGVRPRGDPDSPGARPGTGVSVQSFSLRGPLGGVEPVGSHAALEVGPSIAPSNTCSRASVTRRCCGAAAGSGDASRSASRGRSPRACTWSRAVPGASAPGQPSPCPGCPRRRAVDRPRPLLVLPTDLQGLNPVDDDGDGFTDTLPSDAVRRPPVPRGEAAGGLQRRDLAASSWLDLPSGWRTTHDGPRARATQARRSATHLGWPSPGRADLRPLLRRLRAYVAGGGQVALFGTDSFKRSVRLSGDRAVDPSVHARAPSLARTLRRNARASAARGLRRRAGAVRGPVGPWASSRRSRCPAASPGPRARSPQPGASARPRRSSHTSWPTARFLTGTSQWARQPRGSRPERGGSTSDKAHLAPPRERRPVCPPEPRCPDDAASCSAARWSCSPLPRSVCTPTTRTELIEKRGLAIEEFTEEPDPHRRRPRRTTHVPGRPTGSTSHASTSRPTTTAPHCRLWSIDAHDTLEFPPSIGYGPRCTSPSRGPLLRARCGDGQGRLEETVAARLVAHDRQGRHLPGVHAPGGVPSQARATGLSLGFVVAWDADTGKERGAGRPRP